jgi:hypothetical protein
MMLHRYSNRVVEVGRMMRSAATREREGNRPRPVADQVYLNALAQHLADTARLPLAQAIAVSARARVDDGAR